MKILKKYTLGLLAALMMWTVGCAGPEARVEGAHPEWMYNTVVYEMNVRQQSAEGTFAAAEKRLPFLKELGVDIIWLMPIHPIGEKGRKGSLGSYYAIRNYREVNPEFGTMADFERFLESAHKQGFRVILDYVANHTSPDAAWVSEKPAEWYYRDSLGEPMVQYDWTDISKLNYETPEVHDAMIEVLKFWIGKGVDGFRCDVAGEVPDKYWNRAFKEVRAINPEVYCLAEGEGVHFHENGFDATYSWELLHLMEDVAQGKKNGGEIRQWIERFTEEYPRSAFRLMFTSNHDENSWSGSEFERMGKAAETMAALTYVLPQGQPLIYTGQEVGMDHRFLFFDKDPWTDWTENGFTAFYRRMNALRHAHPALAAGERGGEAHFMVGTVPEVMVFTREVEGDRVLSIFNLSENRQSVIPTREIEGRWTDSRDGSTVEIKAGEEFTLEGWQYGILTRK